MADNAAYRRDSRRDGKLIIKTNNMNKKETELLKRIKTRLEERIGYYQGQGEIARQDKNWDDLNDYKAKQIALMEFQIWLLEEKF